jgi:uncharacterized protein YjbI with pentapeptide repeats
MADPEHLEILRGGTASWNRWRQENPTIHPNLGEAELDGVDLSGVDLRWAHLRRAHLRRALLREADLRWADLHEVNLHEARLRKADLGGAHLGGADLSGAHLREADLGEAHLGGADLSGADLRQACLHGAHLHGAHLFMTQLGKADLSAADLRKAHLRGARLRGADLREAHLNETNLLWSHLREADLRGADLRKADLRKANLTMTQLHEADLREADLSGADLRAADLSAANLMNARLVETNFEKANLTGCAIYGISAWGVKLHGAKQSNLCITLEDEPTITVDSLEVAQFIYLHLHNAHIREVVDTIGKKVVLVLGLFAEAHRPIFEAMQEALRKCDYLPVLFDVQTPGSGDFPETVALLAHLARFVLADVTDAGAVLDVVPHILRHTAVPVQPVCLEGSGYDPLTFSQWPKDHAALLETYWYTHPDDIRASFKTKVIACAEAKAKALLAVRLQ